MFESNKGRYLTRGVDAEIPQDIQLIMWEAIDHMPEPKDYLQVFRLQKSGVAADGGKIWAFNERRLGRHIVKVIRRAVNVGDRRLFHDGDGVCRALRFRGSLFLHR